MGTQRRALEELNSIEVSCTWRRKWESQARPTLESTTSAVAGEAHSLDKRNFDFGGYSEIDTW